MGNSEFARNVDLRKLNSMTKYPSILTYHKMVDRGMLSEELNVEFEGGVFGTEKLDGTCSRIILLPDQTFILGSREELLFAQGDIIRNPTLGIVGALHDKAKDIVVYEPLADVITVFYLEVYGGNVTKASKQYTSDKTWSFRLFDVADIHDYKDILKLELPAISKWREDGNQPFGAREKIDLVSVTLNLPKVPDIVASTVLPTSIEETYEFLKKVITKSRCILDEEASGRPEGLVVRTKDRSRIVKLRFEDYERTLKRRQK